MLLMAVWLQKKENDKEHLFIVKNYSPPFFVLVLLDLFVSLFSLEQSCVCFLNMAFFEILSFWSFC